MKAVISGVVSISALSLVAIGKAQASIPERPPPPPPPPPPLRAPEIDGAGIGLAIGFACVAAAMFRNLHRGGKE